MSSGHDVHHRCPKAQHGSDKWPHGNTVLVLKWKHQLWNRIANGRDSVHTIANTLNEILSEKGYKLKVERI